MEDLTKIAFKFDERYERAILTNQNTLNKYLISWLSKVVSKRTNGKREFVIKQEMNETFVEVFRYLNNDYTLENKKKHVTIMPWNLNKGLFLMGNFGRGKTLLLDCIFTNRSKLAIKGLWTTAYELSKMYVKDNEMFEKLTCGDICLFIDEIGDEPKETLNYGNAENVAYRAMKIFFDKIERNEDGEKKRLFATSNLGQEEIIKRYDERIWSRIVGNCNIIIFGGDTADFRKS